MEDYYYIYKDSMYRWSTASNPVFIAKHAYCRAIPKKEVHKLGYKLVCDFVYDLNYKEECSKQMEEAIYKWELI